MDYEGAEEKALNEYVLLSVHALWFV